MNISYLLPHLYLFWSRFEVCHGPGKKIGCFDPTRWDKKHDNVYYRVLSKDQQTISVFLID